MINKAGASESTVRRNITFKLEATCWGFSVSPIPILTVGKGMALTLSAKLSNKTAAMRGAIIINLIKFESLFFINQRKKIVNKFDIYLVKYDF